MDKKLKKNYIYTAYTLLGMAIYVIFFPIFAKALNFLSPNLTECVYKKMTGKPCPFCGGTRYIANIGKALKDPSYLFHPFGFIILFVIFEVFFRIFCIYSLKTDKKYINTMAIVDILIHSIAILLLVIYEISFLYLT